MCELYPTVAGDVCVKTGRKAMLAQRKERRGLLKAAGVWVVCLMATAAGSRAMAQTQYHIDPAKSQVGFSLGGFHDVQGHFSVSSGEITFDRTTGAMSGTVQVDAASGSSDDKSRDKKMDKDQLKVKRFPTITFAPAKFTGTLNATGSSTVQVQGTFMLLGKAHDITVPMTVDIDGTSCTAKGNYAIPYVEWGVKDPSNFLMHMDKLVKIDLAFSGTLSH